LAPDVDCAEPVLDAEFILLESLDALLESLGDGVAGLCAAGGVDVAPLLDEFGLDWAIAPDSANALNATPNMSLFNIWVLQLVGLV
jgi:hypothetical protein